jgi:hypothetical protein
LRRLHLLEDTARGITDLAHKFGHMDYLCAAEKSELPTNLAYPFRGQTAGPKTTD